MKHIITVVSVLLLLAVSGCGNREKALSSLKSSGRMLTDDAVSYCLAAALNDIFPRGKKFAVNNTTVIKIVPEKTDFRDAAVEAGPCQLVPFEKKYDAVMRKISISDISFGPLEVSARNKNTFLCDMTFTVTEEDRSLFGYSGITAVFVTPEKWSKMNARDKYEAVDDMTSKLPSDSFDNHSICKKLEKIAAQKRSSKKSLRIRWNHKSAIWELHSAGSSNISQASWLSSAFNAEAAASYMKSRGFTLQEGKYYQNQDLKMIEQIKRGYIMHNGMWISQAVITQNQKLDKAMKQASSSGDCLILLNALQETPEATSRFNALTLAKRLLRQQLSSLKRHYDPNKISMLKEKAAAAMVKNENSLDSVIKDITAYQTRMQHYYREKQSEFQKIIDWVTDMYTVEKRSSAYAHLHNIHYLLDASNAKLMQEFLMLWTLFIYPEKINEYRLSQKLNSLPQTIFTGCTSCRGGGEAACQVCSNTRICKNCNGQGYRITEKFEKVYPGRYWNGRQYVYLRGKARHTVVKVRTTCPKECQACVDRQLCRRCYGSGVVIKRNMLKIFIQDKGKSLLAGLKKQYSKMYRQ